MWPISPIPPQNTPNIKRLCRITASRSTISSSRRRWNYWSSSFGLFPPRNRTRQNRGRRYRRLQFYEPRISRGNILPIVAIIVNLVKSLYGRSSNLSWPTGSVPSRLTICEPSGSEWFGIGSLHALCYQGPLFCWRYKLSLCPRGRYLLEQASDLGRSSFGV